MIFFFFSFTLTSLCIIKKKEHREALCAVQSRVKGALVYSLWGSFFSRIPSTPPSDFILKKKPPFLQYSLLGSLKLPGGKPPLPPSSGVEGSVVISPVAISSSFPTSRRLLRLLLEQCRSPTVASHLPLTVACSLLPSSTELHTNC